MSKKKFAKLTRNGKVVMEKECDYLDKSYGGVVKYGNDYMEGEVARDWKGGKDYPRYEICTHNGSELIFTDGGKEVYGARSYDILAYGAEVVLDLVGTVTVKPLISSGAPEFLELNKMIKVPKVVRFDWKDHEAPGNVGMKFWQALWDILPDGKIICCCAGGHGRTGTAAASLMIARGWSAEAAIEQVRSGYCSKAIEGKDQEDYLADLAAGMFE